MPLKVFGHDRSLNIVCSVMKEVCLHLQPDTSILEESPETGGLRCAPMRRWKIGIEAMKDIRHPFPDSGPRCGTFTTVGC